MMMQLFRSIVTIIVVGTMAAMIFSLRSELAEAKARAKPKDGESKSVIADRPHACAEAFSREVDGLAKLAEFLRGAERDGWKWWDQKCSVSCHYYKKNGRRYVAYQNVTGESQTVDGHDLAPHGFLLVEDAK